MSFPDNLKKARLSIGYTQQQVADAMGITNSTYCGYETGKRRPNVEKIKQLANILHTSGDDLLETGFEDRFSDESAIISANVAKNPELKRLVSYYLSLNEIGKKKVMDTAEDMSKLYLREE